MKKTKLFLVAHFVTFIVVTLCFQRYTFAQETYTVGIPVCDTIDTEITFHNYLGGCGPYDNLWFRLHPSLIPYVTGLNFQILITETNGRIWSSLSDTVKIGDTLLVPAPTDSGVKIFMALSSSFKFITRIVGIPTIPHENYYCVIKQGLTAAMCYNSLAYYGEGPICQVQPAVSVEDRGDASTPVQFQLWQNYPNPFNARTTITLDLPRPTEVTLKVHALDGEEIAVLINRKRLAAGSHRINWSAESLPSGIYIYRLQASGEVVAMRKLVLLK